jgi:uncharacterized protein YutE (UPF0331/DUF86 family)
MDSARLRLLETDIQAQLDKIEQVYTQLEDRAAHIDKGEGYVESAAYQLHNLYGAVEDLFKIVAAAFENNIADPAQWHTKLLQRMTLTIKGVRPALISKESAELLNELRAFRHLFRHAYLTRLKSHKVQENIEWARLLRSRLPDDVQTFLQLLGSDDEN